MKQLDAFSVDLSGIHLIEASAGTGKTHAITTLYLRAVVEGGWLPEQILVVTFTRAATGELRERVRQRLRSAWDCLVQPEVATDSELTGYLSRLPSRQSCQQRLERALLLIDQAAVMTIHGFCARVLEQNAFESRLAFSAELIESADGLRDEIVNDFVVTRLALQNELELLALRSVGINTESLRALARLDFDRSACRLEPDPTDDERNLCEVLEPFEHHRRRALEWLERSDSERHLAGLNKTRPKGTIGKRLAGYVDKARTWLNLPFHRLEAPCEAFERLRELASKYPDAQSGELVDWLSELEATERSFVELRRQILNLGVRLRRECVAYLSEQLEARKLERKLQTYDDLLRRLRDTLSGAQGGALAANLRGQYPCAMIDEFQDTDPVQFDLFSRIYARDATLYLIGDPKQSIYAFRGADVDNYLLAKQDPRVECHTLEVNWRSDPGLVAGLERLYASHHNPFLGAGIDYVSVMPRPGARDLVAESGSSLSGIRLLWLGPQQSETGRPMHKYEARQLALQASVAHVRTLLDAVPAGWSRSVRASDIAVLARTNHECRTMSHVLRQHGIRCVQTSDTGVLSSDAAASLVVLMRALLMPNDSRRVTALLTGILLGIEPCRVERWRDSSERWEDWVRRLGEYRLLWARSGILGVVVRACNELEVRQRVLGFDFGERLVTDLFHVAELVQSASRTRHLTLQGQLDWLERARQGEHEFSVEEQQLRIEADSDAVVVTTVHRSKGLQFPFVLCPLLWDAGTRRFGHYLQFRRPSGTAKGVRVVHLAPELLAEDAPERYWAERERIQENARLLYVALTRAKHQVAVMLGDAATFGTSALGQLLLGAMNGRDSDARTAPDPELNWASLASRLCIGEAIRFEAWSELKPNSAAADSQPTSTLVRPAPLERVVRASIRVTSYSALTASAETQAELGRDVDAGLANTESESAGWQASDAGGPPQVVELPLLVLPPGPRTGEALHKILELADFPSFDTPAGPADIAGILRRHGLDAERWTESVRQGILAALGVELEADGRRFRLATVPLERRRSELQFAMKISDLDVRHFTDCLVADLTGIADYADDTQRLRFDPVSGYLRGFIDLVFEVEGRYYVADYKSNALGNRAEDYAAVRLRHEMRRHHYPVQAAIYAAAVDRWLRLNRSDYDYARDFGGVFYLFLRGMVPELGSQSGVYFHRPTDSSIRRFQAMLEGNAA